MLNEDRVKYYTELPSQPFETGKSVFMYEVRQMAEELLSLREQLAELKALEPVAWMDDNGNVCTVDNRLRGLTAECADAYRKYNIPLFTAAKPSVENDIAKFMDGVKNSMAKEVAKVIQKEALLIMFDEITPDTETIAMQYESLVKRINCTED
ncbi:hypothetical protein [Yersinia enterocolitica]